ncbi:TPA: DUF4158 domain-containing protein [Salmonella enterica subsp. enterica serovar Paratyphi B]
MKGKVSCNYCEQKSSLIASTAVSVCKRLQLTPDLKSLLIIRLKDVATICMDPKYILDELLAFLGQQRIALPGYSTVQNLISEVLNYERLRISNIISSLMTDTTSEKINSILHNDGNCHPGSGNFTRGQTGCDHCG